MPTASAGLEIPHAHAPIPSQSSPAVGHLSSTPSSNGAQTGNTPLQMSQVAPLLLEVDELELALELDDAAPPAPPAPPVFPPPAPEELDEEVPLEALDDDDDASPELVEVPGGLGLVPCSARQEEAARETPHVMIANNGTIFAGKGFMFIHLE
jgi:hypothetical protein